MHEIEWLADRFEDNRPKLHAVAYRLLGSSSEAEDAVQESWLRLTRADSSGIDNLGGWLTTVVARVCLDMLRSRRSRGEESLDGFEPITDSAVDGPFGTDPEHDAIMADSIGLALLVLLERLAPAERVAFVLHDMFDLPFDEIALIVGRSPAAARQLASRARRRVRGVDTRNADLRQQREVIDAFIAAARAGDVGALVALLDPDVVLRADRGALTADGGVELRGAEPVAERAVKARARAAQVALVNGAIGIAVTANGGLFLVLDFTIENGRVVAIDQVSDAARLRGLDVVILDQ